MQYDLSIIIPCYNAQKHIADTIQRIDSFLISKDLNYEIIPVNDGSKDDTEKLIDQVIQDIQRSNSLNDLGQETIRKVSYSPNQGKGEAVRQGILHANGEYVIFVDVDLPVDVSCIMQMYDMLKTHKTDFVLADRRSEGGSENASFLRHLVSMFGFMTTKVILGIPFKDTQAGFKGFNSKCAKALAHAQKVKRFAFDMEYLYIARLYNFKIDSLPVVYKNDILSTTVHIVRDSIRTLTDVVRIRLRKKEYLAHRSHE